MTRKSTTQMPVFSTPPLVKMEAREPSTPDSKACPARRPQFPQGKTLRDWQAKAEHFC